VSGTRLQGWTPLPPGERDATSSSLAPALMKVLSDPALAEQMLGDGKAARMFENGYRDIVRLPSALSA